MTNQLTRLRALPAPSAAMREYTEALDAFIEEDQPGRWRAPAGRITAKDQMDATWQALTPAEKQQVRECGEKNA